MYFWITLVFPVQIPKASLEKFVTFGLSALGRMLAVFHTFQPGTIRIIDARGMTRSERKIYAEGQIDGAGTRDAHQLQAIRFRHT